MAKSIDSLVKQTTEAGHYLAKWGAIASSPELVGLFTEVQSHTEDIKGAYTIFLDVFRNEFLSVLGEIKIEAEGLAKQHSAVESLEGKVKKQKAQQSELDAATADYERAVHKNAEETLTKVFF